MKGFSLIEIIFVLLLYTLVLSIVIPRFTYNRERETIDVLEKVLLSVSEKAFNTNQEIVLEAKKGKLITSYGKIFDLEFVKSGYCIVKPNMNPYYCHFKLNNGNLVLFTPLGKYIQPIGN